MSFVQESLHMHLAIWAEVITLSRMPKQMLSSSLLPMEKWPPQVHTVTPTPVPGTPLHWPSQTPPSSIYTTSLVFRDSIHAHLTTEWVTFSGEILATSIGFFSKVLLDLKSFSFLIEVTFWDQGVKKWWIHLQVAGRVLCLLTVLESLEGRVRWFRGFKLGQV